MKHLLYLPIYLVITDLRAQFTHPTSGIAGEYVGACQTATCGGTYMDNGGAGSNYSPNIGSIYRVFCPNTAGNCLRLTFTSYEVESHPTCAYDYLTIGNGPTQNSAVFTSGPALNSGRICGTPAVPFSYTSTDASGCLTVRFTSDGTVQRPGWSANISCVPCTGGPTGNTNADCQYATPVCNNSAFTANPTGPGIVAEGCSAGSCPAGGENFSNWYQVLINTSGTLGFTISPSVVTADFDFAVYGPNTTCSSLGSPVRCNDSGNPGPTGLSLVGLNASENVTGSQWCSQLNVTAGQTYFIVVDSWSPPSGGYSLNWGGTATFNCAILPVKMINFSANYNRDTKQTDVNWTTSLESNIDHYLVERSLNGVSFETIARVVPEEKDSREIKNYASTDSSPEVNEINYYRIVTVDRSGLRHESIVVAVVFQDYNPDFQLIPNPAKDAVELTFKSENNENWEICLYDGRCLPVNKQSYRASASGKNSLSLNLEEFEKGMYFVTLSNGSKQFKRKLIIE